MDNKSFLGGGMKFPPQVNRSTGRFAVSAGTQSVKESVYLILMTAQGERWLAPEFGSRLLSYTFMDTNLTMLSMLSNDLRTVLLEQEPRVSDVDIEIDAVSRKDCLLINITYTVSETNTPENFVFPFYLNAAEGPEDAE